MPRVPEGEGREGKTGQTGEDDDRELSRTEEKQDSTETVSRINIKQDGKIENKKRTGKKERKEIHT